MNEQFRISTENGVMNVTAPIDAYAAGRQAAQESRRMNAGRRIPQLSPMLIELSEQRTVWIFNVSPKEFKRYMGSTGTFTILACEQGKDYSTPLRIKGIVEEPVPKNEHSMELQMDPGQYVAEQIVGIGKMLKPADCLTRYGVFIAESNPPRKELVSAATEEFRKTCQVLVNEMNDAWALGPEKRKEVQTDEHIMAAHILEYSPKQCPWMGILPDAREDRKACPGCGTPYVVGVQKCSSGSCGFILDRPAYEASVLNGDYGQPAMEQLMARKRANEAKTTTAK